MTNTFVNFQESLHLAKPQLLTGYQSLHETKLDVQRSSLHPCPPSETFDHWSVGSGLFSRAVVRRRPPTGLDSTLEATIFTLPRVPFSA